MGTDRAYLGIAVGILGWQFIECAATVEQVALGSDLAADSLGLLASTLILIPPVCLKD